MMKDSYARDENLGVGEDECGTYLGVSEIMMFFPLYYAICSAHFF